MGVASTATARGMKPDVSGDDLPEPDSIETAGGLIYHGAVLTDYALRTGLASMIAGAIVPQAVIPGARRELEKMPFYADLARRQDATEVFTAPPPVEIEIEPGNGPGVDGGRVELVRFVSPYVPHHPDLRDNWHRHTNNTLARAQHWRHESGPRRTLCVIHGFGASPAWLNTRFFGLKEFFRQGWDILMYTMPFHGGRRGANTLFNGLDLFTHGFGHFLEAIIQAVHDFRGFVDYLESTGVQQIGVTGLSLGGYTSALLASAEPRLDFAIPNAPVVWLPDMIDSWIPANAVIKSARRLLHVSEDDLEQSLAVTSPLTYAPVIPKDRLMIIGGLGDRLAPPGQTLLLWEHWGRPRRHWYPGSHIIHVGQDRYFEEMRELMESPTA